MKITLVKVNNETIFTKDRELTIDELNRLTTIVEENVEPTDVIKFEVADGGRVQSDEFDVSDEGIINFRDTHFEPMTGIECCVELGSDEHLDMMLLGDEAVILKFN